MKNLNIVLLITSFIFMSLFANAQAQETVTLVSSKNLHGATEIIFDLQGEVKTESWDRDFIRIVIEIKTKGVKKETIKHLIAKGHFKIASSKTSNNNLELLSPNVLMPVYINGQKLRKDISYQVFVPQNTAVIIKTDELASKNLVGID